MHFRQKPLVFAITDKRIVAADKGKVTFAYKKSGSNRPRPMTLDVNEFIRRYLTHVLPSGFMRIRHYGFMGSGCSIKHDKLVALVKMARGFEVRDVVHITAEKPPFPCPKCGGRLSPRCILDPQHRLVAEIGKLRPKRE